MEYKSYTGAVIKNFTAHDAITSTATSVVIETAGAEKVMIILTGGGTVADKSAVLTITASGDGTNFYAYSLLIDNVVNSNGQQLTRVVNKTRSATGTDLLWMTPETLGSITHVKATLTITSGGSATGNFSVNVVTCF